MNNAIFSNYGFVMIFGILAIATFFIHSPKDKGMKSYRKSRIILGAAYTLLSLYCIGRIYLDYEDLSYTLLVTVTYTFAWMTYYSILTIMEIPKYQQKSFYIDASAPVALILIVASVGSRIPEMHFASHVFIAAIYILKVCRMFYVTITEYFKCKNELENYYDESSDFRWIGFSILCTFPILISSVISFLASEKYHGFYLIVPVFYIYYTIKLINFASIKVEVIRKKNLEATKRETNEKKEKISGLSEKIGPSVSQWVSSKNFCREGLTIKDVAKEMGTNHNYLSQYINNSLNTTFQVWLNTLRIEESKILLANDENLSIEKTGIMVGIPQNYNFSRWFKTITGMTPFQYRKSLSGNKQVK